MKADRTLLLLSSPFTDVLRPFSRRAWNGNKKKGIKRKEGGSSGIVLDGSSPCSGGVVPTH